MINNAMSALSREDESQPNTPLSVCVAMSQAYIGYDLQNALREELRIRGFVRTPVVTVVTQVRVDRMILHSKIHPNRSVNFSPKRKLTIRHRLTDTL